MMAETPILTIEHLSVAFDTEAGTLSAVDDVSFTVEAGTTLGIVGESGCGKSVTAFSIMRLLPQPAGRITGGAIRFKDTDIRALTAGDLYRIRGNRISMIFQEPMTALNPVQRIGRQISEVYRLHFPHMSDSRVRRAAIELLDRVSIPDPEKRFGEYPHQISGGMRQRVMIAMALACRPDILIADEPTTALDVTIQAQILEVIDQLQKETGMAVIFITHDLGVIAEICDSVLVMYAGQVAETASVDTLFSHPAHPYTQGLLRSIPRLETPRKERLAVIEGMVPTLDALPPGCRFQNRCPHAMAICKSAPPPRFEVGPGQLASCYLYGK
jgi:oligopeptide/dipeptide ABC transporter ATP-binding protein